MPGQQVTVRGEGRRYARGKLGEAHRSQRIGRDHFRHQLVQCRAVVVVVEGQVLVAIVVRRLVVLIGVVQREESPKVYGLAGRLVFVEVREELRQLQQIRTYQEGLYPQDRQQGPEAQLHTAKVGRIRALDLMEVSIAFRTDPYGIPLSIHGNAPPRNNA